MILEIEDAGEAGAGEFELVPSAIGTLGVEQVTQATVDGRMPSEAGGDEAEYRPGSL